jgi:hypothetical protein
MRYGPEPEAANLKEWAIENSGALKNPDRIERAAVEAAACEGLAVATERLAAAEERVAAARERQLLALQQIIALEAGTAAAVDPLPARRPAGRASVRVTRSIAAGG